MTVIACFSFILGIYFKPSRPAVLTTPPVSVAQDKTESINVSSPPVVSSDTATQKATESSTATEPATEILVHSPNPESIPIDTPLLPSDVSRILGFIKEIKANSFVLEFLTTQFATTEEKFLQREFLIDSDSKIIIYQALPETASAQDLVNPDTGEKPKIVNIADTAFIPPKYTLLTSSLKDLRVGDYVKVITDVDLNSDTTARATEVRAYPLNPNPYLEGKFTTYEGLPTEGDFALLGN